MVDARTDGTNTALESTDLESPADHSRETVIPLFEEEVSVSRRVVPTSRVQVSRVTHSHEHLVDELLERERVEVERVAIDKPIDHMPSVREEGDYLIFPVVEEVLKIERVLVLKEEVRIRATALKEDPEKASERLNKNPRSLKDHLTKRRQFLLEQAELRGAGKFDRAAFQ